MRLVLLDSHALIHRAYHALPPNLTSPTGEPTNATYGFTSTLLKVLSDLKPDCIAATFDVGHSFRREQFAEYKGTRAKLPDDLAVQLARSRDVVAAFGIPAFGVEKYEADDLLGTLAKQAQASGVETVIVTGDTDTFQLVNDNTKIYYYVGRTGEMLLYNQDKVKERYGLEPRQMVDYKALKGDSSDNIPGVPGVGDKTATKLLQTYRSVENLYEHVDSVEPKLRDKLTAAKEKVLRAKQLVTIVTDAPVELDLDACRVTQYDRERVLKFFRQMGFRSLIDRLPNVSPRMIQGDLMVETEIPFEKPAAEDIKKDYHLIDNEEALDALVSKLKTLREFVVDVETTDNEPTRAELVGIAIGMGQGEAFYIPLLGGGVRPQPAKGQGKLEFDGNPDNASRGPSMDAQRVLEKLRPVLENETISKLGHNAKYDATVLAQAGVQMRGIAFDTMIAANLVESTPQSNGLKNLVFEKFGVEMTEIEALIGKGKKQVSMADVNIAQISDYACADADYTFRLVDSYRPELAQNGAEKLFYEVEMPLVAVLIEIERTGVLLDLGALSKMSKDLAARMGEIEKEVQATLGNINLASPQQLGDALVNKIDLPPSKLPKTRTGQVSTAAEVLESLRDEHPIIALILEHRELSKLKGTYVDALPALVNPKTGRVHTDYNQAGAITGRVSSSNPNLQNIPIRTELGRLVRRAFIAPPGSRLVGGDYSQVELRVLAHITHDPGLLEAFARGEDIHASTAARLFNVPLDKVDARMRRLGKSINFGIAYGITDYGISSRTELSRQESRELMENYFTQYAQVKEYIDQTKREAHERGYVQTLLGRRRYFPELKTTSRVHFAARNAAEREAINMPIQGSAADIIKLAMIRLHRELHAKNLRARMILQVHDELVLECPDGEVPVVAPLVREIMENAYPLESRLKVDINVGANWDEMKAFGEPA
jgi:DNA polymerase I